MSQRTTFCRFVRQPSRTVA